MRMKRTKSLKENHPQKYWMKLICKLIYYFGLGECWYEESPRSRLRKFYFIWAGISNMYMFIILLDELLSYFREDLVAKEKNDLMQFSIAHPLIGAKIIVLYLRRDQIKILLERLLEGNRAVFPSWKLDKQSVKTAMLYCFATSSVVYLTLIATIIDAILTHFNEGIPIRTEVTYFPGKRNTSFVINVLRVFIELHWWYLVSVMNLIDFLSLFSLSFTGFKFRRVRLYFENLRRKFMKNKRRNPNVAEEKQFWLDFVDGIKLHEDALWCARHVQHSLGYIYSVQIVESIGLITICLVKLVTIERNFILIVANLAFTVGLVVITGAYMMDAAEITHEASLIPTAIFHCGWEFTTSRADLRTLVVTAIQRSQVPVYMTAFGIITLSYTNFITVMRSSYSFFAVMF